MKITISKQIVERGSLIRESFSFSPQNRITTDTQRDLQVLLRFLIERLSISPEYKLISAENISSNLYVKTYEKEEGKRIPNLSISFSFNYFPRNGKKKCKSCKNLYKKNFCLYKNKKLKEDFYNNCWGYLERGSFELDFEALQRIQLFQ